MNPLSGYLAAGALIAMIASGVGGFFGGRHVGSLESEAAHARADAKDAKEQLGRLQTAQAGDDKGAAAEGVRSTTVREITREVPKFIDRPVYRNICIDADGVRSLARAVEAANGLATSGGGPAGRTADVRPDPAGG